MKLKSLTLAALIALATPSVIHAQRLILPNLRVQDTSVVHFLENEVIGTNVFERNITFLYKGVEGTYTVSMLAENSSNDSEMNTKKESGAIVEEYKDFVLSKTIESTLLPSDTLLITFFYLTPNENEPMELYAARGIELAQQLQTTGGYEDAFFQNQEMGNPGIELNINDVGEEGWPTFSTHAVGEVYSVESNSEVYIIKTISSKPMRPGMQPINNMRYDMLNVTDNNLLTSLSYIAEEDGFAGCRQIIDAIQVLSPYQMDEAFGFPLTAEKKREHLNFYEQFVYTDEYSLSNVRDLLEMWEARSLTLINCKSLYDGIQGDCLKLDDILTIYQTHEAFDASNLIMNDSYTSSEDESTSTETPSRNTSCALVLDELVQLLNTSEYYLTESDFNNIAPQFKPLFHKLLIDKVQTPGFIYESKLIYRTDNQLFFAFGIVDESFSFTTMYGIFDYQFGSYTYHSLQLPEEFYEFVNESEELFQTEVDITGMPGLMILKSTESNHVYVCQAQSMTQNNWTMMNASIPAKQAFAVKVPDAEYSEYNKSLSYYTTEMASALDPNMKELLPAVMNQLRSEYAIGECYSMFEPVNLSDGSCAERYAYENAVRTLAQPKDWVYLSLPIYSDFNQDGTVDIASICASNGKLLSVSGFYLGAGNPQSIEMKSFLKLTKQNHAIQNFLISTMLYQD